MSVVTMRIDDWTLDTEQPYCRVVVCYIRNIIDVLKGEGDGRP
jgi:hypothetical protein